MHITKVPVLLINLLRGVTLALLLLMGSATPVSAATYDTLLKELESLNLLLSALADTPTGQFTVGTGVQCVDGGKTYQVGNTIPGLTLPNGIRSQIRGYQYRCTNGRWIMEYGQSVSTTTQNSRARANHSSGVTDVNSTTNVSCSNIFDKSASAQVRHGESVLVGKSIRFFCNRGKLQLGAPGAASSAPTTCSVLGRTYNEGDIVPNPLKSGRRSSGTSTDRTSNEPKVICQKGAFVVDPTSLRRCTQGGQTFLHGAVYSTTTPNTKEKEQRVKILSTFKNAAAPSFTRTCVDGRWRDGVVDVSEYKLPIMYRLGTKSESRESSDSSRGRAGGSNVGNSGGNTGN